MCLFACYVPDLLDQRFLQRAVSPRQLLQCSRPTAPQGRDSSHPCSLRLAAEPLGVEEGKPLDCLSLGRGTYLCLSQPSLLTYGSSKISEIIILIFLYKSNTDSKETGQTGRLLDGVSCLLGKHIKRCVVWRISDSLVSVGNYRTKYLLLVLLQTVCIQS